MTTVVNIHNKNAKYDVLVDRTTDWGNPFTVRTWGRTKAVQMFRAWLPMQAHLMARLHELKGKRLGCHCGKGKMCHARVLAEFADAL